MCMESIDTDTGASSASRLDALARKPVDGSAPMVGAVCIY